MDDDFRIRVADKAVPFLLQILPQFLKIVDFSIKNKPERAVFIAHGLTALFAQINNGEAAVGQRDAVCTVYPLLIRPTVCKLSGHFFDQGFIMPGHPANSTHLPTPC